MRKGEPITLSLPGTFGKTPGQMSIPLNLTGGGGERENVGGKKKIGNLHLPKEGKPLPAV